MCLGSLLKRFVKDYSLPIRIFKQPYFDYYMELYNSYFDTKQKYKLFVETVDNLGGEENFFEKYQEIKEEILNAVKNCSAFKQFNTSILAEYDIPAHSYSAKSIFNFSNVGKYFVSVDLKKANFASLKRYDKDIVMGADTYEEFMKMFTDLEYMMNSKYIRQVIFGNLNPKKQIKIQKYLTYNMLDFLIKHNYIDTDNIKMTPDEIVFEIEQSNLSKFSGEKIGLLLKEKLDLDVDVEAYRMGRVETFDFFVKEFLNKQGQELMCVPIVYFAQVYKKYFKLELNEYDLCFWYENQIAKFLSPLEV